MTVLSTHRPGNACMCVHMRDVTACAPTRWDSVIRLAFGTGHYCCTYMYFNCSCKWYKNIRQQCMHVCTHEGCNITCATTGFSLSDRCPLACMDQVLNLLHLHLQIKDISVLNRQCMHVCTHEGCNITCATTGFSLSDR